MKNKILVVGDLILDNYLFGETTRISPEAPVPIFKKDTLQSRLGGAGNLAVNLLLAGNAVTLLGALGNDAHGKTFSKLAKEHKIDLRAGYCLSKTTTKTRVVSRGQQIVRIDDEEETNNSEFSFISKTFFSLFKNFDLIVLSDYDKGVISFPQKMIGACKKNKKNIFVDPKKIDIDCYRGATMVTPNLKEFSSFKQYDIAKNLEQNIQTLSKENDINNIVVTLGSEGVVWGDAKGNNGKLKTDAVSVADVTGAGDTFLAYLITAFLNKKSVSECIKNGNKAAGIVVGKLGTYGLTLEELHNSSRKTEKKIFLKKDWGDLHNLIESKKKIGQSIVFTNGCFDILHLGHIQYLKESSLLGDIFIVGVNSDNSVRKLKGDNRPINPLNERASVLQEFSFIDCIVEFDEETPLNLIKKIMPQILTKGSDYNGKNIVGSDLVKKFGGEVKIVNFKFEISTTSILKAIKDEKSSLS